METIKTKIVSKVYNYLTNEGFIGSITKKYHQNLEVLKWR